MTEESWLNANDHAALIEWYGENNPHHKKRRKLFLFGLACASRDETEASNAAYQEAVWFLERIAVNGFGDHEQFYKSRDALFTTLRRAGCNSDVLSDLLKLGLPGHLWRPESQASNIAGSVGLRIGSDECAIQTNIFRDIVGNPFQPVESLPQWLTAEVVGLTRAMNESNDYYPMPVLADALEEAGCNNAAILDHCRDPNGIHVRGCWVVDTLLGKS